MHICRMWGEAGEPGTALKFCSEKSPEGSESATFLLWRGNLNICSSPQTSFHRFNHKFVNLMWKHTSGEEVIPIWRHGDMDVATRSSLWDASLWAVKAWRAPGSFCTPQQQQPSFWTRWSEFNLHYKAGAVWLVAFMNICHQEWFLKRKKRWIGL